jgi:hypothetical protein
MASDATDELASATHMSRRRINLVEAGHHDPTYDQLLALDTEPTELVILTEQLKQPSGLAQ